MKEEPACYSNVPFGQHIRTAQEKKKETIRRGMTQANASDNW